MFLPKLEKGGNSLVFLKQAYSSPYSIDSAKHIFWGKLLCYES
jgi:hypothetical protein